MADDVSPFNIPGINRPVQWGQAVIGAGVGVDVDLNVAPHKPAVATSRAYVSRDTIGGTVGDLTAHIDVATQKLQIRSANALDTSTVNWMILG